MPPPFVPLTLVTSEYPPVLTKQFDLLDSGKLKKSTSAQLAVGRIEILEIADLEALAKVTLGLRKNQALIFGLPKDRKAKKLVTEARLDEVPGAIARTKDDFEWNAGPGYWMLDYDPPDGQPSISREALVAALHEAVPALRGTPMLWMPSSSSHICRIGGEDLTGLRGQRLYVVVDDARDIPRAGRALIDRLWLAGHGYMRVSSNGSLLPRTLVDAAVWEPNRLDFAAGASVGPGLEQRRGAPILIPSQEI